MKLRITTRFYVDCEPEVTCNLCKDNIKNNTLCRFVYTNTLPCSLYVKLLRSTLHITKFKYIHEICDLTGKKFIPCHAMCICDECYKEYFETYYCTKDSKK